jgi:uncharacterized membrane protein
MNNLKLGWKRGLVKASHLVLAFLFGLFSWGIVAQIINIEPNKIVFVPLIIIASLYVFLSLYHKKVDITLMVKKLSDQTGLDVQAEVERMKKDMSKDKNTVEKNEYKDDKK